MSLLFFTSPINAQSIDDVIEIEKECNEYSQNTRAAFGLGYGDGLNNKSDANGYQFPQNSNEYQCYAAGFYGGTFLRMQQENTEMILRMEQEKTEMIKEIWN